jgi:hypothetical protein
VKLGDAFFSGIAADGCSLLATDRSRSDNQHNNVLLAPFLIPGGTLLETMQISGRIPASLSQHWWWEAFVMAHQVWALLILSMLLVRQMWVKYIFHPVSDKVMDSHA